MDKASSYYVRIDEFEKAARKIACSTPEYMQLFEKMRAIEAKQDVLENNNDIDEIRKIHDEYEAEHDKLILAVVEFDKKLRAELMKDPEMAKLVDVYE